MENIEYYNVDALEATSQAFLDYSAYNLQRRAIPDARDGLRWSQRQLLHAQSLAKLDCEHPFKKASKSVAAAMSYSYTHGDSSAYGIFIRMAKPFVYRVKLQEATGNYGTQIDSESHAASRYVELRGSELASALLQDLDKDTITEWEDTYDMEGKFPRVLPSKGFTNLVNGCQSIGSGMNCSIPPFNLVEVNEALIKLLNNPDIDVKDIICMPDFPTGATLLNASEVKQSLIHGSGSACKIRATVTYDKKENTLIVSDLPYQTYTNTICKQLAEIINNENDNPGIESYDDFTGKKVDVHIHLKKNSNVDDILLYLYKNTSIQSFYAINMIMLDNGITPKQFGWKEALQAHLDHEKVVYRRGFEYDLAQLEHRKHILEGYLIVLADIEEVVKLIKSAESAAIAKQLLIKNYLLDDEQASAVLKLTLSRLAHLEVEKIKKELEEILADIDHINTILNDTVLFNKEIENGLRAVIKKYGDKRRTEILDIEGEADDVAEIKTYQVSITNRGNIVVQEYSTLYNADKTTTLKLLPKEEITKSVIMTNKQRLFMVNENNEYATLAINRYTSGKPTPLPFEVPVVAMAPVNAGATHIVIVTANGMIKKSAISEYNLSSARWVKAITADGKVASVEFCQNNDTIGVLTNTGYFMATSIADITSTGRISKGVKINKLSDKEYIVAAHVTHTPDIYALNKKGYKRYDGVAVAGNRTSHGKRLAVADFVDFTDTSTSTGVVVCEKILVPVDLTVAGIVTSTAKVLLPKI